MPKTKGNGPDDPSGDLNKGKGVSGTTSHEKGRDKRRVAKGKAKDGKGRQVDSGKGKPQKVKKNVVK